MARKETVSIFLSFFTGTCIVLYWGLIFTGVTPVDELIPGYVYWAKSYVAADAWITLCTFLAGALLLKQDGRAFVPGLLAAGSMIFLALNATAYSVISGVLSRFSALEIAVKLAMRVYYLVAGVLLIYLFAKSAPAGRDG